MSQQTRGGHPGAARPDVLDVLPRACAEWDPDLYESVLVEDAVEGRPQDGTRFVGRERILGMCRAHPADPPAVTWPLQSIVHSIVAGLPGRAGAAPPHARAAQSPPATRRASPSRSATEASARYTQARVVRSASPSRRRMLRATRR